jgi:hypothetical protein
MLDLRHAGARSEELSRGCSVRFFLGGALEVESFIVGGLATLLGSPSCSSALGHDSMRLMRSLIAMRSSSSMMYPTRRRRYIERGENGRIRARTYEVMI